MKRSWSGESLFGPVAVRGMVVLMWDAQSTRSRRRVSSLGVNSIVGFCMVLVMDGGVEWSRRRLEGVSGVISRDVGDIVKGGWGVRDMDGG